MKTTLRPLLLVASLGAAILLSSNPALAQAAGGFSAGPGLAAPTAHEQTVTTETTPKAAADTGTPPVAEPAASDQAGYITRVQTYRPSPSPTQVREFTQSRMWVLDPGKYTAELWWTGELTPAKNGALSNQEDRFQAEVEMGIAPHFQLDCYFNVQMNQVDSQGYNLGDHTGVAVELRWAIPDYWGETFMNPTLYFELQSQYNASPRAEVRVLLGGEVLTPRLLGAMNLLYEQNIFWGTGPTTTLDMELQATGGLNYEIVDGVFRLGAEIQAGGDMHGGRTLQPVLFVGPGLILKTKDNRAKIMATFFFGTQPEDATYKPVIVASLGFN